MFVKLNNRVYINTSKITKVKMDENKDGVRIRFYEGRVQVAKSPVFASLDDATVWIKENMK